MFSTVFSIFNQLKFSEHFSNVQKIINQSNYFNVFWYNQSVKIITIFSSLKKHVCMFRRIKHAWSYLINVQQYLMNQKMFNEFFNQAFDDHFRDFNFDFNFNFSE